MKKFVLTIELDDDGEVHTHFKNDEFSYFELIALLHIFIKDLIDDKAMRSKPKNKLVKI